MRVCSPAGAELLVGCLGQLGLTVLAVGKLGEGAAPRAALRVGAGAAEGAREGAKGACARSMCRQMFPTTKAGHGHKGRYIIKGNVPRCNWACWSVSC